MKRTLQNGIKYLKEVWATNSAEFGRYDYQAPDGSCWNADRVEDKVVHLWTINAHGRTRHAAINVYEFKVEWKPIGNNATT